MTCSRAFLILLLFFFNSAFSQPDLNVLTYLTSNYGKAPDPKGNFSTLVIPIKRVQNLLLIEARINNMEGNFILDTGAPHLVLNKTYFRQGKLSDGTSAAGITGGGNQVYHVQVDSLIIENLFYTALDADVVNLGHLEDAKGVKILGLLGANLFSQMEMEIDLQHSILRLSKTDGNGQLASSVFTGDPKQPDLAIPFELDNNIIFVNTMVAGKKLRFCFDSGAETNVLSNGVGNKVLGQFSLMSRAALGGTSNQRLDVLSGQLTEMMIGNHSFKKMPVILADLSGLREVYNTDIDGILGYDFMSNGSVIINFKKKELTMYFYKEEGQ
ncbi:MAG: aspartyl protease family protein [Chitinophagales bacterium]